MLDKSQALAPVLIHRSDGGVGVPKPFLIGPYTDDKGSRSFSPSETFEQADRFPSSLFSRKVHVVMERVAPRCPALSGRVVRAIGRERGGEQERKGNMVII